MKLSEAIREGAKIRPQTYGIFFETNDEGDLCSCAEGAAYEAITGAPDEWADVEGFLKSHFADLMGDDLKPKCPACRKTGPLYILIPHMNDDHRLTREAIADFVQQAEGSRP